MHGHIFILHDWFDIHYLLLCVFCYLFFNELNDEFISFVFIFFLYTLKPKSKFDDAIHSNNIHLYLFVLLKSSRAF